MIGTLWPIGDKIAVRIADEIYTRIAQSGDVADAVHAATREMRRRFPNSPSTWAAHIHSGA